MAPTNTYLMDETIQARLAAHDRQLIKGSTTWFPGEDPEVHWDFNRSKEFELLGDFLDQFSDIDFRDGKVTIEDAARATYGSSDEYLVGRITTTHMHPASGFNKTRMNGQVAVVAQDGSHIIRDDRLRIATERYQAAADKFEHRVAKSIGTASKSLKAEQRRSMRIAPDAGNEVAAITEKTWADTSSQGRLAIGQGE